MPACSKVRRKHMSLYIFLLVVLGMTKVKVTKEESGSLDFVEKRRAALER